MNKQSTKKKESPEFIQPTSARRDGERSQPQDQGSVLLGAPDATTYTRSQPSIHLLNPTLNQKERRRQLRSGSQKAFVSSRMKDRKAGSPIWRSDHRTGFFQVSSPTWEAATAFSSRLGPKHLVIPDSHAVLHSHSQQILLASSSKRLWTGPPVTLSAATGILRDGRNLQLPSVPYGMMTL